MKYVYTAVFSTDENGTVFARVPDLPGCITTGDSIQDAIEQITDAASGWLVVAEDKGIAIKAASPQQSVPHEATDILSLIRIDTIAYRAQTDTRAVRKNVSIPAWMSVLADKRGINCSKLLQESLLAKLST